MSRSLGSAVDYSIIARRLQMAEDVYYAENRIFNAAFWGYGVRQTSKQLLDIRVIKGMDPTLVKNIIKQSDAAVKIMKGGGADALAQSMKEVDKIASQARKSVTKIADDAWKAGDIPSNVVKAWDDIAVGSGKSGRKLFAEAAGNTAHAMALKESAGVLSKEGFEAAAKEVASIGIAPSLREITTAATKRGVMKAAVKSQEAFGWLLEQGTNPRTFKYLKGAGGLTVVGLVVWQGYKITNAIDNAVNKAGKTLFGESWEGGDGLAAFGADNPVAAGMSGWLIVAGGVGLLYVLFKPKRAVVVS